MGRILDALGVASPSGALLTARDLAPVDQLHIGGAKESEVLFARSGIVAGMRVLDLGCGLGGPARMLARAGCQVVAVDLSLEYCQITRELTVFSGLSGQIHVLRTNALHLPFRQECRFDACWMQHVNMNISDKQRLLVEIARTLAPGGVFAFHEVFQGPGGSVKYPTPWATSLEVSHLTSPSSFEELLLGAGLVPEFYEDRTAFSAAWFSDALARRQSEGPKPLGLHLLFGEKTSEILQNMSTNLNERCVEVRMGMARKAT